LPKKKPAIQMRSVVVAVCRRAHVVVDQPLMELVIVGHVVATPLFLRQRLRLRLRRANTRIRSAVDVGTRICALAAVDLAVKINGCVRTIKSFQCRHHYHTQVAMTAIIH
jgi:hypothetical protein